MLADTPEEAALATSIRDALQDVCDRFGVSISFGCGCCGAGIDHADYVLLDLVGVKWAPRDGLPPAQQPLQ